MQSTVYLSDKFVFTFPQSQFFLNPTRILLKVTMLKTTLALALVNGAMGQTPADIRWQTASDCYQREMVAAGVSIFSELRLFFSIQDTPHPFAGTSFSVVALHRIGARLPSPAHLYFAS